MIEPQNPLHDAKETRLAAAAGVVMESLDLSAPDAFEWIMDASHLTGIPVFELADLVFLEGARRAL
jgi:hypothetical protein